MGYLQIASMPSFSRGVISLWFNIPSSALDVANSGTEDDPYYKRIPLITFGSRDQQEGGPQLTSYLVVDVRAPPPYSLEFFLLGPGQNSTVISGFDPPTDQPGEQDSFSARLYFPPDISLDAWNHVLLSFDIGGSASADWDFHVQEITTTCRFTWNINDIDRSSAATNFWTPYGVVDGQWVPDQIDSYGWAGASSGPFVDIPGDQILFSGASIASDQLGIPTDDRFVERNCGAKIAYFQMFTGAYIDTRDTGNRRAFITGAGRPAPVSSGAELIGHRPVIQFNTAKEFKAGLNKGTAGSFSKFGTLTSIMGP